jgi:hypothetical protein
MLQRQNIIKYNILHTSTISDCITNFQQIDSKNPAGEVAWTYSACFPQQLSTQQQSIHIFISFIQDAHGETLDPFGPTLQEK